MKPNNHPNYGWRFIFMDEKTPQNNSNSKLFLKPKPKIQIYSSSPSLRFKFIPQAQA
jgi:hypothetical protein